MPTKKWTSGRIATWIGIASGAMAIIGTVAVYVDEWIVTDAELKDSEQRIILKIEHEAVKTRTVYISELLERKGALENQLENETLNSQQVESLTRKIDKLDKRIEKLRGR